LFLGVCKKVSILKEVLGSSFPDSWDMLILKEQYEKALVGGAEGPTL
jgi:hypothetical protein